VTIDDKLKDAKELKNTLSSALLGKEYTIKIHGVDLSEKGKLVAVFYDGDELPDIDGFEARLGEYCVLFFYGSRPNLANKD